MCTSSGHQYVLLAALYPQDIITASVIDGELAPPAVAPGGAVHHGIDMSGRRSSGISPQHFQGFPNGVPPPGLYHRILKEIEVPLLTAALAATRGNQIRAADLLGLNRNTLRKKIRDLDIQVLPQQQLIDDERRAVALGARAPRKCRNSATLL